MWRPECLASQPPLSAQAFAFRKGDFFRVFRVGEVIACGSCCLRAASLLIVGFACACSTPTPSLPTEFHILKNQCGCLHAGIGVGIVAYGDEVLQKVEEVAGNVHFGYGA